MGYLKKLSTLLRFSSAAFFVSLRQKRDAYCAFMYAALQETLFVFLISLYEIQYDLISNFQNLTANRFLIVTIQAATISRQFLLCFIFEAALLFALC